MNQFARSECIEILDREAAELWRSENPDVSVFNCSVETKDTYRRRVFEDWLTILHGRDASHQCGNKPS